MSNHVDVYNSITQKIIQDLEKGKLTWRKPWSSEHLENNIMRPLRWNDVPYSGINIIMLWATTAEKNFTSPYWMTFKQAQDMKAHVKKGEKASDVVFADKIIKEEKKDDGILDVQKIPFLKLYKVFNANQIEGLPKAFYKCTETKSNNPEKKIDEIEKFFAQKNAQIYTGQDAAYYQSSDKIEMPPFESFHSAVDYYATLAHEMTHWTKHPTRLAREFGKNAYGNEGYAQEELVAELGACFLGADLGFEPITKENHAAYIQSWLKALQNDKKFIFTAASHAQKAIDYLNNNL